MPQTTSRPTVIAADQLTKRYGDFTAVDGISFEVPAGESFGLLGPNGAGKSTTMRMIGAVSSRTGGSLDILGLDPDTHGPEIRSQLGVVPFSFSRNSRSQRMWRACGSSPVVGSSRRRTFGSLTSPRAIVRRRFMPPDRAWTFDLAFSVSCANSRSSSAFGPSSARVMPKKRPYMMRFSRTRSSSSRLSCCGMTPRCARTCGPWSPGSMPRTDSSPPVRSSVPPIMRIVVDLPAPFGPSSPKLSPGATSKSMPSTATKSPYVLRNAWAWMAGGTDGR